MFNKIMYNFLFFCNNSMIMYMVNQLKNTRIQKFIYSLYCNTTVFSELFNYCLENYTLLNATDYNRNCDIDSLNDYSIVSGYKKTGENPKIIIYDCLKNILDKNIIFSSDLKKNITINDCVIFDYFETGSTKFKFFHTDLEYDVFCSAAFNIWYLIENKNDYGNMFLLEAPEYKKSYTPCFLNDADMTLNKNTYLHAISSYYEPIAKINIDTASIKYLNMVDGDCLVMSKHLLHRTDIRRDSKTFKGFNFRVIIRNDDGSIEFNGTPPLKQAHHVYKGNKIYNVEMFDFI